MGKPKTTPESAAKLIATRTRVASHMIALRTAINMHQSQFARTLGLTRQTYNQFETGIGMPSILIALQICDRTGCTMDLIYRGKTHGMAPILAAEVNAALKRIPEIIEEQEAGRGRPRSDESRVVVGLKPKAPRKKKSV